MRASAILGIWKAAVAYVPLDTALPGNRINVIATKTQMRVILYQTKHSRQLISSLPSSVIKIDLDTHVSLSKPATGIDLTHALQSKPGYPRSETLKSLLISDLVMCIFTTSGNTGDQNLFQLKNAIS